MQSKDFIETYLIKEVHSLLEAENFYPLMVYATIGIETLGAIIDSKPIRARGQSKSRFNNALYQLFPNQYSYINKKSFLFESLRNHASHNLIPSSKIKFINKASNTIKHLNTNQEQILFVINNFGLDFIIACEKAIELLENGNVKSKNIAI